MRAGPVVQRGLRTPTGPFFARFFITIILGLVAGFAFMWQSTRLAALFFAARWMDRKQIGGLRCQHGCSTERHVRTSFWQLSRLLVRTYGALRAARSGIEGSNAISRPAFWRIQSLSRPESGRDVAADSNATVAPARGEAFPLPGFQVAGRRPPISGTLIPNQPTLIVPFRRDSEMACSLRLNSQSRRVITSIFSPSSAT
jgi:hypothetical protein